MVTTVGLWVYVALACIALFPPLLGLKPFTHLFAMFMQPRVVQKTKKYILTCLILNYMWLFIFVVCGILSCIVYSDVHWLNLTLQNGLPAALQIVIALPLTLIGQKWIPQFIYEPNNFKSVHELFELMPYGLNLRYAKRINANGMVQFILSGREAMEGYLTFNTRRASFTYGIAPNPTCTVRADSELWLGISNTTIDSIGQSIARTYSTEGDTSIMLHLMYLFTTQPRNHYPLSSQKEKGLYSEYRELPQLEQKIKKVVVFYSGDRAEDVSKTYFMVEHITEGMRIAGADVEIVKLKEKNIKNCLGCFSCWTNTPGKCIHNDDMEALLRHFDTTDLMVFASPLYVFSVNGRMKTFLDRMIPRIQPYMAFDEQGNTYHPKRSANIPPIVVVSAGGFPEVSKNFDGLRTLFRDYAQHMEGSSLRGELLLPAAEYLSIHTFEFRKHRIANLCIEAGKSLIQKGEIPINIMQEVSDVQMEKHYFGELANKFWKHLDGNISFLKYIREERKGGS